MGINYTNLLWTGGWDSSFRLLQLTIILKKHVQPYYIFDTNRKSIIRELEAMQSIRNKITADFPDAAQKISNTIYAHKDGLEIPNEIRCHYQEFAKKYHIGSQYLWLSAFSKSFPLHGLELSIEKDNYANTWMEILAPHFISDGNGYYLNLSAATDKKVELFSNFRFPLIDTDKSEMEKTAKEFGFYNILINAWFCHNPILGMPCGLCKPCQLVLQSNHQHNYQMANTFIRNIFRILRFAKAKWLGFMPNVSPKKAF
jgi:hypothetical protein